MSGDLIGITDNNFRVRVLESDKLVIVDFWAPWCGPCQAMAPVMEALATAYAAKIQVFKCNVDSNPQISARHGIQSIPTLIAFRHGKPVEKIIGLVPAGQIKAVVDRLLAGAEASAPLSTV